MSVELEINKHCSLASRWLKRDKNVRLEGITENGLPHAAVFPSIHPSIHPSVFLTNDGEEKNRTRNEI